MSFHDILGVCFWTAPAIIAALGMVIMGIVHGHNQKKRDKDFEKDLEDQLSELYADDAVEAEKTV